MSLADQWDAVESELPDDWVEAHLRLMLADEVTAVRAAALLGPLGPGRRGPELRLRAARTGTGPRPDALGRGLQQLDDVRIDGRLELVSTGTAPLESDRPAPSLAAAWRRAVAALPPDWSDAYVELELLSSDRLALASLRMTPLNARRADGRPVLLFRAARTFGYGGSPAMVERCLARCDDEGIAGTLRILRVLSDTRPVATQGPVWQIGGRTT